MLKKNIIAHNAIENDSNKEDFKIKLQTEKLDISKRRVQTRDVKAHKEVIREEKTIVVPVIREELVIEKKEIDKEALDEMNEFTETVRIPISEEQIEVIKHPIYHEDVAMYKRQQLETVHVEEVVQKEVMHVKTTGNPQIIRKET